MELNNEDFKVFYQVSKLLNGELLPNKICPSSYIYSVSACEKTEAFWFHLKKKKSQGIGKHEMFYHLVNVQWIFTKIQAALAAHMARSPVASPESWETFFF